MNDKDILASAPEGATHYDVCTSTYWHNSSGGYYLICSDGSKTCNAVIGKSRSLADIRALVKQQNQLDDLYSELESKKQECYSRGERIKELEKGLDALLNVTNQIKDIAFDVSLTDHDTMVTKLLCVLNSNLDLVSNVNSRNVAKALKAHNLEQQAKGIEDFFGLTEPYISIGKNNDVAYLR